MNAHALLAAIRPARLLFELRQSAGSLLIGVSFSALAIMGIYHLSLITGAELPDLTRDFAAITDSHLYYGVLSTLGLMLWACTAGICLAGALVLWKMGNERSSAAFLFFAGALTAMLGLDDGLLLHERVFPNWLGIPEEVVYLAYMASLGAFLIVFMPRILRTDYLLLGVALLFMGLSVAMDHLIPYTKLGTFVEDCCKFVGIVFWLGYFWSSAHGFLRKASVRAAASSRCPA